MSKGLKVARALGQLAVAFGGAAIIWSQTSGWVVLGLVMLEWSNQVDRIRRENLMIDRLMAIVDRMLLAMKGRGGLSA